MPKPQTPSGLDYLRQRSRIAGLHHRLPPIETALVLSADPRSASTLEALLHLLLGYGLAVGSATTLGAALDGIAKTPPDILLIDDRLPPGADPVAALAVMRSLGCRSPVLVCMGRPESLPPELGPAGAIRRDDLSASRIAHALLAILDPPKFARERPPTALPRQNPLV